MPCHISLCLFDLPNLLFNMLLHDSSWPFQVSAIIFIFVMLWYHLVANVSTCNVNYSKSKTLSSSLIIILINLVFLDAVYMSYLLSPNLLMLGLVFYHDCNECPFHWLNKMLSPVFMHQQFFFIYLLVHLVKLRPWCFVLYESFCLLRPTFWIIVTFPFVWHSSHACQQYPFGCVISTIESAIRL